MAVHVPALRRTDVWHGRYGPYLVLAIIAAPLLAALLSRPGAVWTHRQLLTAVWGGDASVTNDTLRVHMGSLRRKLEAEPNRPRWITTEPWVGYRFSPDA